MSEATELADTLIALKRERIQGKTGTRERTWNEVAAIMRERDPSKVWTSHTARKRGSGETGHDKRRQIRNQNQPRAQADMKPEDITELYARWAAPGAD